jgi:hypothetical protein
MPPARKTKRSLNSVVIAALERGNSTVVSAYPGRSDRLRRYLRVIEPRRQRRHGDAVAPVPLRQQPPRL